MPQGQAGRTRTPGAQPRPAPGIALRLLPVLPLVLAVLVHRRAFDAFFGTDDFMRLEQAVGLLPATPTLWRLVSEVLYVKLMLGLFGPQPLPFHIVSMALHLVNTAFVYRTGRRAGLSSGASCFAASAFGAFPIFYTVLLSAVNINDIMSLTFVFLALLALERPTLARGAVAVACFAIAFLSKEAILFVPFAALLLASAGESPASAARRLAPLLVASVAMTALYLMFRTHGIGTGGQAYTMGIGPHVVHNLMTYSWWSVDVVRPVPDAVGQFDTSAWRVGTWPLLAFAITALLSRARARIILFGCAWWLLGLVPVLPLTQHTYGHYLYVPMAGFVIAVGGVLEAMVEAITSARTRPSGADSSGSRAGRGGSRPAVERSPSAARAPKPRAVLRSGLAVGVFVLLGIAFAFRCDVLIGRRASERLGNTAFALDPFTRKMEVARAAVATLRGQLDRDRDTVVVFTPPGLGKGISSRTGREVEAVPSGAPSYDVTEAVLDGGRALRLFEPRLDSVVFARRWTPDYREFTLFTEAPGGRLQLLGRGARSHSRYAAVMIGDGFFVPAREYLEAVITAYPDDRMIQLLYAIALSRTGAPDSARARALRLIEGMPPDTIAGTARRLIAQIDAKK